MYINSSYKNHSVLDFKDKSKPLIVGSCGTYRLSSHPKLPTYRPRGRVDFQIIYIASGRGYSCAMKSHFRKSGNQMSGKWKSSSASLPA